MIFFFKKPKIVLDCFTDSEAVAMTAPIEKASAYLPEWWKQLGKQYYKDASRVTPYNTSKTCPGIIDYYSDSIALPTWCEFKIETYAGGSYNWMFSDEYTSAVAHPIEQYTGFVDNKNFGHIKINSPWVFKCREDINWLWSQSTYNFGSNMDKIFTLPGVTNYSKVVAVNINIMVNLKEPSLIEVGVNVPLVHITPLTEKQVEIKRHVIDRADFEALSRLDRRTTFLNSAKRTAKAREEHKGCPYTGGFK